MTFFDAKVDIQTMVAKSEKYPILHSISPFILYDIKAKLASLSQMSLSWLLLNAPNLQRHATSAFGASAKQNMVPT
jgi:hypothetical protein